MKNPLFAFLLLSAVAYAQATMSLPNGEQIPRYGWDILIENRIRIQKLENN